MRVTILDGGTGRELRFRGVDVPPTIWSAKALIVAPDVVADIHRDYIAAGAEIITTNSYGVIRSDLAMENVEHRFAELNTLAGRLARDAANAADRPIRVAGGLPPLRGSYRPDLVGTPEEIIPLYAEQAALLAPYVDLFICETMSSIAEARSAATAALSTGKPVWVGFTLHEDRSGRLRSGESVADAVRALSDLPLDGVLANCCAPESIAAAMPDLVASGLANVGGYANTFIDIDPNWTLTSGLLGLRDDLEPDRYADMVLAWREAGATVIGGCCGTRPAHIAAITAALQQDARAHVSQ